MTAPDVDEDVCDRGEHCLICTNSPNLPAGAYRWNRYLEGAFT